MVAAYLRVSTDKQTVLNQEGEVQRFCKSRDIVVTDWIMETVSGTKSEDDRQLGRLLRKLRKGDTLIVTEVSRLSRKMINILNIIYKCIEDGITVLSIKEGYTFDDSINSQVLAFSFGLSAEIERKLISQRTREALAQRKAAGVILGRPRGSFYLKGKKKEIDALRKSGKSYRIIGNKYNVSRETVRRYYLRRYD